MTTTSTTRCNAEGRYWHEAADADGNRIYGPSEPGQTATCRDCGEALTSQIRYAGSAWLGEFGGVRYSDSERYRDPLAELARAIGAKLPFSVHSVGIDGNGRQAALTGSFAGGSLVTVTIDASSDIRWYSEAASDDDKN